ncbi:hypothetical protein BGX34_001038 [Mortierella sp. NVP85]|nr:hypothetical protein BGX34_001038 [Mortierella sp. NVP85]
MLSRQQGGALSFCVTLSDFPPLPLWVLAKSNSENSTLSQELVNVTVGDVPGWSYGVAWRLKGLYLRVRTGKQQHYQFRSMLCGAVQGVPEELSSELSIE